VSTLCYLQSSCGKGCQQFCSQRTASKSSTLSPTIYRTRKEMCIMKINFLANDKEIMSTVLQKMKDVMMNETFFIT
jgi:hypothetical protein